MDKDNGALNIQDSYLGRARKERGVLTIFLNNGKKIVGRIRSFDRYTVIVEDHGVEQMIFKHAISTISVARSFGNAINFERAAKGTAPAPGGAALASTGQAPQRESDGAEPPGRAPAPDDPPASE